jgi:hypothetical protein
VVSILTINFVVLWVVKLRYHELFYGGSHAYHLFFKLVVVSIITINLK